MTPQIFPPKSNCEDTVVVAVHLQSTSRKMVHYIGQTVHFLFSVSGFLKLISQPARHRRRFAPILSVPTLLHLFCRLQSEASTQHAPDATHYFASSASSDVSAKLFTMKARLLPVKTPEGRRLTRPEATTTLMRCSLKPQLSCYGERRLRFTLGLVPLSSPGSLSLSRRLGITPSFVLKSKLKILVHRYRGPSR